MGRATLTAMLTTLLVVHASAQMMVDRTLAIVGGRTITLSDARGALALGLVEGRPASSEVVEAAVLQRLVDRELMLREAERYRPPEPAADRIDAGVAAARARAGGDEALHAVLREHGFSVERLRAWVRDDLRIAAYLQQRFAADERRADLTADWLADLRRRAAITIIQ